MNRQDILNQYDVDSRGMITNPGKFESESVFVPAFWDATMDGTAEELCWPDEATTYLIELDDSDRAEWPELGADTVAIHLEESDSGFVSCECLTASELEELRSEFESASDESDPDEEDSKCSDPVEAARLWHDGQWSGLYRFQCNNGPHDPQTASDAMSEAESVLAKHPDCDEAEGLQALIDECRTYLESNPLQDEEESSHDTKS